MKDKYYEELKKNYKNVLKQYRMGFLTKEECLKETEELEYRMLDIEAKSGV